MSFHTVKKIQYDSFASYPSLKWKSADSVNAFCIPLDPEAYFWCRCVEMEEF